MENLKQVAESLYPTFTKDQIKTNAESVKVRIDELHEQHLRAIYRITNLTSITPVIKRSGTGLVVTFTNLL